MTQEQTIDDCKGPNRYVRLVDMRDETNLREVGVLPEPVGDFCSRGGRFGPHNLHENRPGSLIDENEIYVAYFNAGLRIYDVSDPARPRVVGTLNWSPGGDTHTCLPLSGRALVVITDEAINDRCREETKLVRVADVSDPARPEVLASCPAPSGDFCKRGLRFGPHNLHENRADTYVSERIVFVTYFNAGLRVYDLASPERPVEIAHWIAEAAPGQPATQANDLLVDMDGYVYVTDRVGGGLFVLQPDDDLAAAMEDARS